MNNVAPFVVEIGKADARIEKTRSKPWQIYLLGSMRVIGPRGVEVGPLPRKTRGLLAVLCLAHPQRASRSRLTALLWDGPEDRSRRNLRHALYMLHRLTDAERADLLVLDHEFVRLNAEACWVDLIEAPEYHPGRLLDDLDGISPAFDHWLSGERSRAEDRARGVLEAEVNRLSEEEAPAEQRAAAARRLVNFDATDETGVRALMTALADMGEHTQALREYERGRAALRSTLGVSPARKTTALYEAIRVTSPRSSPKLASGHTADFVLLNGGGATQGRPREPSIAVLPFRNLSGDPRFDCTADGIAEDFISALSRIPGFFVISRLSTLAFRKEDRLPQDIGDLLDVQYLMSGSMRALDGSLYLTAELADAVSGVVLWSARMEERYSSLISAQLEIVQEIVRQVAPHLRAAELRRVHAKRPEQLDAYDLFLSAQERMHNSSVAVFNTADRMFEEAIRRCPHYATALAWRAYWHVLRIGQGWSADPARDAAAAAAFAHRAVECDPFEPMSYAVEGHIASFLNRDFETAFGFFEKAVRLNPNAAPAWLFSGAAAAWLGDGSRAVEEISKAIALSPYDPLSYANNAAASVAYCVAGQYERAVEFSLRAIRENKTYTAAYRYLIIGLVLSGRPEEARAPVQTLLRLEPRFTIESYKSRYPGSASSNAALFREALAAAGVPLTD